MASNELGPLSSMPPTHDDKAKQELPPKQGQLVSQERTTIVDVSQTKVPERAGGITQACRSAIRAIVSFTRDSLSDQLSHVIHTKSEESVSEDTRVTAAYQITFGQQAVDTWAKAKQNDDLPTKMKLIVVPTTRGGKTVAYVPSERVSLVDKFKGLFGFGNSSLKKLSKTIVQQKIESSAFADKAEDFNNHKILRKIDSVTITELRNNSYKVLQEKREQPIDQKEIEPILQEIEADSENRRCLIAQLANAFPKNRSPELSSRLFEVVAKLQTEHPYDPFFSLVCGKILTQKGKLDDAEDYVTCALALDSTNSATRDALIDLSKGYTEKAGALYSASAVDAAKEKIEKALKYDPINGMAYLLLTDVDPDNKYKWLGKAKECVVSLQKNKRIEEAAELDKKIHQLHWESITVELDSTGAPEKRVNELPEYANNQYLLSTKLNYPISEGDIYVHLDELIDQVKDTSLKETLRELQSNLDDMFLLQYSNQPIPQHLQQDIDVAIQKINELIK